MTAGKDKKADLKALMKRLHEGANAEEVKEQFKEAVKDVTPTEIAQVEEELIEEGMPQEEIQEFCDVHLGVLKGSLEKEEALASPRHPIYILMEEHKMLLNFADELRVVAKAVKVAKSFSATGEEIQYLNHIAKHFHESESHYVREENVLFPYLEKHGVTHPPAIMWSEHNKIREIEKNLYGLIGKQKSMAFPDFTQQLHEVALALAEMLSSHFYKENHVLFPTALQVIGEGEWKDVRHQFDELGYCCFTPEPAIVAVAGAATTAEQTEIKGAVTFETGALSREELEALFDTLPVDVTFVGSDDTVRFFSQSKDRIFPRTKAIIGRKVQLCHPQQSVHVVERILSDFRSGKQSSAAFWIDLNGRKVYIQYFAVRDNAGKYLGCLEVTQDVTDVKKIEGQKRLLEYKKGEHDETGGDETKYLLCRCC